MGRKSLEQKEQEKIKAEQLQTAAILRDKLSKLKTDLTMTGTEVCQSEYSDMFHFGPPVSPVEFIESERFYNNKNNRRVYPWVIELMEEVFSKDEFYMPKYQTVVVICGKGSGKSYAASLFDSYLWYLMLSFKNFPAYMNKRYGTFLDQDTTMMIIGMAKHANQAKEIVFSNTAKMLQQVGALRQRNWLPNPKIGTRLEYNDPVTGAEKVIIMPGNSSTTFAVGYALFGGVIDEATLFKEKSGSDPVEEMYTELNFRRESRFGQNGVISLIGSAMTQDVFAETLFARAETDPTILAIRKSTYDCNPRYFAMERFSMDVPYETAAGDIVKTTIHPPLELKPFYELNLYDALRSIDGIPALAGRPFYPDFVKVESKINRNRVDPAPDSGPEKSESPVDVQGKLPADFRGTGGKYRIHVDLAKGNIVAGHCGCGFAMAHKESDSVWGHKYVLDLSVRFKAASGSEVKVDEVLNFIKWLKIIRNFDIEMVTFDKWNSLYPIQTINDWKIGILADELSVGYREHAFFRAALNNGQLDMFEDKNLLFEMKRLEDYDTSVDCGNSAFKDEADAAAGAIYSAGSLEPGEKPPPPRTITGVTVPRTVSSQRGYGGTGLGKYRNNLGLGKYRNF